MKVKINTRKDKYKIRIDDSDLWNLDITLARIIHPALKKFRTNGNQWHPSDLKSRKQWNKKIKKMEKAFKHYIDWTHDDPKHLEEIEKGLKLFVKYFGSLWI